MEKNKQITKVINVLQVFFHCQTLNGALYLDWDDFHMQSIFKKDVDLMDEAALVHTFL